MNTLYFVETTSPRVNGPWFLEVDRDSNSRAQVIELIRSREVCVVKVLEVNEDEGWVRDVTDDLTREAGPSDDYRTTLTGEDKRAWEFDRAHDHAKNWEPV